MPEWSCKLYLGRLATVIPPNSPPRAPFSTVRFSYIRVIDTENGVVLCVCVGGGAGWLADLPVNLVLSSCGCVCSWFLQWCFRSSYVQNDVDDMWVSASLFRVWYFSAKNHFLATLGTLLSSKIYVTVLVSLIFFGCCYHYWHYCYYYYFYC